MATIAIFIYLYLDKKAVDRLLREQRGYQNALLGASGGMIRIKDLRRLLNLVVHVVTKTVRIRHASVYLLDKENDVFSLEALRGELDGSGKQIPVARDSALINRLLNSREVIFVEEEVAKLRDNPKDKALAALIEQVLVLKAALIVPSFVDSNLIGFLALGEKRSNKLYSTDDAVVFSVLANQAALAIENAQFYEEVKKTHEQLFQAEKLATIGTMADGLSHQINNRFHALSLIAGDSLDILKTFDASACDEKAKEVFGEVKNALERIENNVLQGGEIVKGLLKYSRPGEEGEFEPVAFVDVLSGAIDMVQYKIKLKEIDLVRDLPPDLPKLRGNLTQLQEVFFNLIDNAYDAIKERQMTLNEAGYRGRIEVFAGELDGAFRVRVADNGMGIKGADRKKLFTPFFTTKATARKGTGLGLYVIEKIIAAHSGRLQLESAYQSGTTFIITLPIAH